MPTPRDCPCHSGQRYGSCCAPFHRGEREAPTAEALMRSRFAAFALGLGPYLVRTLAVGHEDRAQDPASLAQLLSRAKERQRFLGLTILEASPGAGEGDGAEVLFHARVFERGVDRSFVELSTFRREGGGFRYESGVMLPAERVPAGAVIDRASFLALVEAGR